MPKAGGRYVDGTVGMGGHAEALLQASSPSGELLGVDVDAEALERAGERLKPFGSRLRLCQGNYSRIDSMMDRAGWDQADGILLDLGVSSVQLLSPERGFSFQNEGPIDMRMDRSQGETVADYLARVTPAELENRLTECGEGAQARRLARFLIGGISTWRTTSEMAAALEKTLPRRGGKHPATRVFLALRMAVNRELDHLKDFLEKVGARLTPGGRLVIITFHSLEDRAVKWFGKENTGLTVIRPSFREPSEEEMRGNPMSRSAKMRVFEKT